GADSEILVVAAKLFRSGVEDDEVVDEFEEARLAAHLDQGTIQWVLNRAILLPRQIILLRCVDRAVTQTLGVIACHDPLHCGKEMLDEDLLLVVEILADALGHRDGGTLQFQDGERYAIDIKHYIRALGV